MGSWSVYCGISNITIDYGTPCVLVPIKKNTNDGNEYHKYTPATTPIFGVYNDYGGLDNIEETEGTKLIEKHFNCTIQEFAHFFTRGIIRNDESDFPKFLKDSDEISNWKFMFIHREVYNYMIQGTYESWRSKSLGDKNILTYLGFNLVDKVNRTMTWEKDGVTFTSDGDYLRVNDQPIHRLSNSTNNENDDWYKNSSLSTYVTIDQEKEEWLNKRNRAQIWSLMDKKYFNQEVCWIIGRSRYTYDPSEMILDMIDGIEDELKNPNISEEYRITNEKLLERYKEKLKLYNGDGDDSNEDLTFIERVVNNYKLYADDLANLIRIQQVFYSMSGTWTPFNPYLTPQCGSYVNHSRILKKFMEINDKHIENEEEYDD